MTTCNYRCVAIEMCVAISPVAIAYVFIAILKGGALLWMHLTNVQTLALFMPPHCAEYKCPPYHKQELNYFMILCALLVISLTEF